MLVALLAPAMGLSEQEVSTQVCHVVGGMTWTQTGICFLGVGPVLLVILKSLVQGFSGEMWSLLTYWI